MKGLSEFRTVAAYYDYLSIISGNDVELIKSMLKAGKTPEQAVKHKSDKSKHPYRSATFQREQARKRAGHKRVEA